MRVFYVGPSEVLNERVKWSLVQVQHLRNYWTQKLFIAHFYASEFASARLLKFSAIWRNYAFLIQLFLHNIDGEKVHDESSFGVSFILHETPRINKLFHIHVIDTTCNVCLKIEMFNIVINFDLQRHFRDFRYRHGAGTFCGVSN